MGELGFGPSASAVAAARTAGAPAFPPPGATQHAHSLASYGGHPGGGDMLPPAAMAQRTTPAPGAGGGSLLPLPGGAGGFGSPVKGGGRGGDGGGGAGGAGGDPYGALAGSGRADEGGGGGSGMYSPPGHGRPPSRQIRPLRENALEAALKAEPGEGEEGGGGDGAPRSPFGARAGAGGAGAASGGKADPAQLAGVEGAGDLPAPDPLSSTGEKEAGHLIETFGMYVVRCFCSRAWNLREAAVAKMAIELPKLVASGRLKRLEALSIACGVVADIALKDRIANMFITAVDSLLSAALNVAVGNSSQAVRRADLTSCLEPVNLALLEKLGDNTPKVREAAVNAAVEFALPQVLGAGHMATALMRRPSKSRRPTRAACSRAWRSSPCSSRSAACWAAARAWALSSWWHFALKTAPSLTPMGTSAPPPCS